MAQQATPYVSDDLQWLLTRHYSSFLVKKAPGIVFTREPGNVKGINQYKYSGLANSKTVDIRPGQKSVELNFRKPGAGPNTVGKGRVTRKVRASGGRRVAGIVSKQVSHYRPDLRKDAVARASALVHAVREPKADKPKRLRGRRAAIAKAEAEAEA